MESEIPEFVCLFVYLFVIFGLFICLSTYLYRFTLWIHAHHKHVQAALFLDGQRQTEEAEWVKGHGHHAALRTDQGGLELAVKQVGDDGVVALLVVLPRLLSHGLVGLMEMK